MDIILGIDPGDKHNGLVSLNGDTGAVRGSYTLEYREIVGAVMGALQIQEETEDKIHVCMEIYQLYPQQTRTQAWNTFPVVEVIGIVKHLTAQASVPLIMARPPDVNRFMAHRKAPTEIPRSGLGAHQLSAYRVAEYYRIMYLPEVRNGKHLHPYDK